MINLSTKVIDYKDPKDIAGNYLNSVEGRKAIIAALAADEGILSTYKKTAAVAELIRNKAQSYIVLNNFLYNFKNTLPELKRGLFDLKTKKIVQEYFNERLEAGIDRIHQAQTSIDIDGNAAAADYTEVIIVIANIQKKDGKLIMEKVFKNNGFNPLVKEFIKKYQQSNIEKIIQDLGRNKSKEARDIINKVIELSGSLSAAEKEWLLIRLKQENTFSKYMSAVEYAVKQNVNEKKNIELQEAAVRAFVVGAKDSPTWEFEFKNYIEEFIVSNGSCNVLNIIKKILEEKSLNLDKQIISHIEKYVETQKDILVSAAQSERYELEQKQNEVIKSLLNSAKEQKKESSLPRSQKDDILSLLMHDYILPIQGKSSEEQRSIIWKIFGTLFQKDPEVAYTKGLAIINAPESEIQITKTIKLAVYDSFLRSEYLPAVLSGLIYYFKRSDTASHLLIVQNYLEQNFTEEAEAIDIVKKAFSQETKRSVLSDGDLEFQKVLINELRSPIQKQRMMELFNQFKDQPKFKRVIQALNTIFIAIKKI